MSSCPLLIRLSGVHSLVIFLSLTHVKSANLQITMYDDYYRLNSLTTSSQGRDRYPYVPSPKEIVVIAVHVKLDELASTDDVVC